MTTLTTRELATRWGIPEATLRGWRATGKGPPFFKPAGTKYSATYYHLHDIEAWERQHTTTRERL